MTFATMFDRLCDDTAFVDWYSETLAAFDAQAFFWELPALRRRSLAQPAEFVMIEAPMLAKMRPQPDAFEEYFARQPDEDVVVFANLGGDATMVVPSPRAPDAAYGHLAAFLRGAPAEQIRSLWPTVAQALLAALSDAPVWLSTAGGGVAWLHVRLDSQPKYYRYAPYRNSAG